METLPTAQVSKPGCLNQESAGTYEAKTTSRLLGEMDLKSYQKLSQAPQNPRLTSRQPGHRL